MLVVAQLELWLGQVLCLQERLGLELWLDPWQTVPEPQAQLGLLVLELYLA
jgi:hypothetical protein